MTFKASAFTALVKLIDELRDHSIRDIIDTPEARYGSWKHWASKNIHPWDFGYPSFTAFSYKIGKAAWVAYKTLSSSRPLKISEPIYIYINVWKIQTSNYRANIESQQVIKNKLVHYLRKLNNNPNIYSWGPLCFSPYSRHAWVIQFAPHKNVWPNLLQRSK